MWTCKKTGRVSALKKKKGSLSGFVGSPRFQIDPAGQAVFSEPVASPGFAKFRPGPRL